MANYIQTAPPKDHPHKINFCFISSLLNLFIIKLWIALDKSSIESIFVG